MAKRSKKNGKVCTLSGALTIYSVREQHQLMREALAESPTSISLDLDNISEIDAAGLQLLLWWNKTCAAQSVAWSMTGNSDAVSQVLAFARANNLLTETA